MGALRQRLRKLWRVLNPGPAILMYHRIAEPSADPWEIAVSPAHFDDQLAALKQKRQVLPMDAFVRRLRAGDLPSNAVAITFDDGYLDNLTVAKPILEKHGLPATVFLSTGLLGRPDGYWWDELSRLVLEHQGGLAASIVLGGETVALALPDTSRADGADRGWRAPEARDAHQALYLDLWARLQPLSHAGREAALMDLRRILGARPTPAADAPMQPAQVKDLAEGGLVSIGAHTLHHPRLTDLSPAEQVAEIEGSRLACEALADQRPTGFAYPYGNHDAEVAATVKEAGFDWACTTVWSVVRKGRDNPYALPRVPVLDADGDRLLWRMKGS